MWVSMCSSYRLRLAGVTSLSLSLRSSLINDPTTTQSYPLSLHDALPIWSAFSHQDYSGRARGPKRFSAGPATVGGSARWHRSEEHTSELQSRQYLVCRLLLEKKNRMLHCIPRTATYSHYSTQPHSKQQAA